MIAKIIIAGAVILLMACYVIPEVTWPIVRQSLSEAPPAGDLAIIGIVALGAVIVLAGIVGIFVKRM